MNKEYLIYIAVCLSIISLLLGIAALDVAAGNDNAITTTMETVGDIANRQQTHIDITKINNDRINVIENELDIESTNLNGYEVQYLIVTDLNNGENRIQWDVINNKYIIITQDDGTLELHKVSQ